MPDLKVIHEHNTKSGRYIIRLSPDAIAEMSYHRTGDAVISIDHTRVPQAFRGNKIAERLIQRATRDARENGIRIIPVCSYVEAQFRRHPEWADLLAR